MDFTTESLSIAYLNCRGQTGFNEFKQVQIENVLQIHELDILRIKKLCNL